MHRNRPITGITSGIITIGNQGSPLQTTEYESADFGPKLIKSDR